MWWFDSGWFCWIRRQKLMGTFLLNTSYNRVVSNNLVNVELSDIFFFFRLVSYLVTCVMCKLMVELNRKKRHCCWLLTQSTIATGTLATKKKKTNFIIVRIRVTPKWNRKVSGGFFVIQNLNQFRNFMCALMQNAGHFSSGPHTACTSHTKFQISAFESTTLARSWEWYYHTCSMFNVHTYKYMLNKRYNPHRACTCCDKKRMIIFSNAFAVYSPYSWMGNELKIESNKLDTKGKPQIIFKWEVKSCSESVYIRLITPFNESVQCTLCIIHMHVYIHIFTIFP